jgi:preprotein translocase subunit SecD
MMQLLIRTRFYGGGHRWSGLDPVHLGATASTYRGRGQFASGPPGRPRQTIAERRAEQERAAAAEREPDTVTSKGGDR